MISQLELFRPSSEVKDWGDCYPVLLSVTAFASAGRAEADPRLPCEASPDHVDWSVHFPSFFEGSLERLQLNTAENPIECSCGCISTVNRLVTKF